MPGLNGLELIRQIRAAPELRDVVIMATSASVYHEDRQRCFEAGAQAFLPKPIEARQLFDRLQQILHLDWQYAEEAPPPERGVVIPPPPEELEVLREYAKIGGFIEIEDYLDTLEQRDPIFQSFVEALRALTATFQIDAIHAFLQSFQSQEQA